jgi:AbiV family abortive infection protein
MKELYKLKKEEYRVGAEKTLLNSQKHYEASLVLSKAGLYPFAITHIISAAEELMKAMVLRIKSIDNGIAIPNLDEYFKKHKTKHDTLLRAIKYANKDVQIDGATAVLALIVILILSLTTINKPDDGKDDINSIEKIRLSTIYVEFLNSRKWRTPQNEYGQQQYKMINDFYKEVEPVFENLFNNNIPVESLKDFIDNVLKDY